MDQEHVHSTASDLAKILAHSIASDLKPGNFLVLPGGSSPQPLIKKLAQADIDWPKITITTTDERCVPIDSPDSNAGQIVRLFEEESVRVHPLPLWRDHTMNDISSIGQASVTVLGMGTDGHIASLFPGEEHYECGSELIASEAPNPPHKRISMTYERLLNTQRLILLISGPAKHELYEQIKKGQKQDLPLARLINKAKQKLEIHITKEG